MKIIKEKATSQTIRMLGVLKIDSQYGPTVQYSILGKVGLLVFPELAKYTL